MVYDYYKEKSNRKNINKFYWIGGIALFSIVISIFYRIYTDVLERKEMGNFQSVYWTDLKYQVLCFILVFSGIFLSLFFTNKWIRKNYEKYFHHFEGGLIKVYVLSPALIFAFLGAMLTKNAFYKKGLMFLNHEFFGVQDPVFGLDVGYYVFSRPFFMLVYEFFSLLSIFLVLYTLAYYLLLGVGFAGRFLQNGFHFDSLHLRPFFRHFLFLVCIFFFIRAFSYRFLAESILYRTVEGFTGPGFVDVRVWLLYFKVIPFLLLGIVGTSIFFIHKGKIKRTIQTIALFPALWALVTLMSLAIQFFWVTPNVASYEAPYIQNHIAMTRKAFGLDRIMVVDFPSLKDLTPSMIERNRETVSNIRVIDYPSTLISNRQLQSLTNFYTFYSGNIVNFPYGDKDIPVFIAPREIESDNLPDKSYLSKRFRYTHGYGVVVNPINKTVNQGQVDFLIGDLENNRKLLAEPRIYYGQLTDDYVLVNAAKGLNEFDYDGSLENRYEGEGGVYLKFINRLLYAVKLADYQMLVSGFVDGKTKLLLNREVVSRAQKALPFLEIDPEPYITLTKEGRLKWVLDAYTVSSAYPNAQRMGTVRYGNLNYIRNSVKIIIDAYHGGVQAYIIDEADPIIKAYQNIYPDVFEKDSLPEDVKDYMKYPEYLFEVMTAMLRNYHLEPHEVNQFFSKTDLWKISKTLGNDRTGTPDIEPFYNMIRLPMQIGDGEEFILMRPFSPSGDRNNMVSWLAARNRFENYGELVLFRFLKNTNILGPQQIGVRINQNEEVSTLMTLLGQTGSDVYKGNLLVIPIEESILYIEPIYVRADVANAIPEVKRVVAGFQRGDEFIFGVGVDLKNSIGKYV
jgi:uncharacterized protein